MYRAIDDPYCYPGSAVLRNRLDIRDADRLAAFEGEIVLERAAEPLPAGHLSSTHFLAIHKHLFQDVYPWAGNIRTVRISKDGSTFCYPEHIASELRRLFSWLKGERFLRGLSHERFAFGAAHFLADLNAIHAFREGNGRAQMAFMSLLAAKAGHPLHIECLNPADFLSAMIASFRGEEAPLRLQIALLAVTAPCP